MNCSWTRAVALGAVVWLFAACGQDATVPSTGAQADGADDTGVNSGLDDADSAADSAPLDAVAPDTAGTDAAADAADAGSTDAVSPADSVTGDVQVLAPAHLCDPCTASKDCGTGGLCVTHGTDGSYCATPAANCPDGYVVSTQKSVEGTSGAVCVPATPKNAADGTIGPCACSESAIAAALWTTCSNANLEGTCPGKRLCSTDGLTLCDAITPTAESCDGVDENCNGLTDEGTTAGSTVDCSDGSACTEGDGCTGGKCVGTAINCDDGNPCTTDGCDPTGGCTHAAALNGTPCEDGNKCTTPDTCQSGACVTGPAVVCASTNPCQPASCDPVSGSCLAGLATDGTPCDDGNACTQGETCAVGLCTGPTLSCNDGNPCTDDSCDPKTGCVNAANQSDCSDGDACTGPDICGGGVCVPGSAKACDDGSACTADGCDSGTGSCTHSPIDGVCDDGLKCTGGDACVSGVCVGTPLSCDDSNPCTDDSCDPVSGCTHAPTSASGVACDDGSACTIGDACSGGTCKGATALTCDDGNPCTDNTCNPASGCDFKANTSACDDGNACTAGDTCANGSCQSGASTCQCQKDADCAAFADSNLCNGTLICTANTCTVKPGSIVVCAASTTTCMDNVCNPATGVCALKTSTDGTGCNDGSACTQGEACATGICKGIATTCDDNNPCTTDSCNSATGCVFAPNTNTCDDGSSCTTGDTCAGGLCVGVGVNCDDGNACTTDSCDQTGGCAHANNTAACEDGNLCTVGDACAGGACQAGAAKSCDDSNTCTADSCDPTSGCIHTDLTQACDDGNACTANDACLNGKCQGGMLAVVCNDKNPCTADSCDPTTAACVFTPIAGCGGNCLKDADCPSTAGGCQTGACDLTSLKCTTKPAANGTSCTDKNACTTGETCTAGACAGGMAVLCNDGNPCTADVCDKVTGACTSAGLSKIPCDDGNPCTTGDACFAGVCTPGILKDCNDFDPCTADACAAGSCTHTAISGCTSTCTTTADCAVSTDACLINYCDTAAKKCASKAAANLTACSDGNACTTVDGCLNGTCSGSQPVFCKDSNGCTDDTCNPATGACVHTPNTLPCSDANPCTSGDQCSGGTCVGGAVKVCNDNNPCTADSCDVKTGACAFKGIPGCGGVCKVDSDCPAVKNACTISYCDTTTDQCASKLAADGTTCDDGSACTANSACTGGTCTGAITVICNDLNNCTTDSCLPATGKCLYTNQNGTTCGDGNPCTVGDLCQGGKCQSGAQKVCNDGVACTADACNTLTGACTFTPIPGCGSNCNTDADCAATGSTCSTATCNKQTKLCTVSAVPNGTSCTDNLACTLGDVCKNGVCESGVVKTCNDGNPCTIDACTAADGTCTHAPASNVACADGDPCTATDTCTAGVCAGTPISCGDGNSCTEDTCAAGKCVHTALTGCGAACKLDSDCPASGSTCQVSVCAAKVCAVKPAVNGAACDDGDACTDKDACENGTCLGVLAVACDDNNACTTDFCAPKTGKCDHTPLSGTACNDGNPCTATDTCTAGACAGTAKTCDDNNPCTTDACNPNNGYCVFTPIAKCK